MSQPSIEFYNDALDALQAGDLHGARSAVESSLTENPSDAETWQLYIIVLNALGLSAEARKASEKAQSLGVSEADMLLLEAAQAGSIGDHAAMLSHYEEALRISPERADIHAGYALALLEGDQSEAALAAAQKAVSLDPNHSRAQYVLGRIYRLNHEYESAYAALKCATSAEPDFAIAEYECGMVLHQLGRSVEALEHFEKVLEINPSDVSAGEAIKVIRSQMS